MRYTLISDNWDTLTGMRLAGVTGTLAYDRQQTRAALLEAVGDPEIAVILITEALAKLCPDEIYDLKLKNTKTLVVEIPNRHGTGRSPDSITRYIREAIGIKV